MYISFLLNISKNMARESMKSVPGSPRKQRSLIIKFCPVETIYVGRENMRATDARRSRTRYKDRLRLSITTKRIFFGHNSPAVLRSRQTALEFERRNTKPKRNILKIIKLPPRCVQQ